MNKINRRDFLKLGATATAAGATALALQQGARLTGSRINTSAAAPDDETTVKTTCALCPSGCGLEVRVVGGKAVKIEGNPLHPLNQGVCCLKGQTALEVLYSPERIQHPRIQTGERGSGDWKEVSWDEALDLVARKLAELRGIGSAHSLALLHGETRGQMRAQLGRFMQAYGSPNLIGRDSLGEGVVRLASYLSQGVNGLPVYDLNNANYVMTFGGNLLESSRNVIGALGSLAFMRRGRPQRGKLVAVHPRLSLTGIKADEWVPIRPGTYGALALGMANVMINSQLYAEDFVRDFTFGFEDFTDANGVAHIGFKRLVTEQYTLERVAAITGIGTEVIARLAGEFASNHPAVAVLPTEPGELGSGNSLHTALAIHALNALVGSIDTQGGVLVQRFPTVKDWPDFTPDALAEAGLASQRLDGAGTAQFPLASSVYQNVARRILDDQPYPINALLLFNANPAYEIPDNGDFVRALLKVPFVVSFASMLDESAAHADVILPASTFLEVWGDDYLEGTGYAGVSLRRPVVAPVYDTRNPGEVILQIAQRLGGPVSAALPWQDYLSLVKYRLSAVDMDWAKLEANGCWSELVYFNAAPGSQAWSNVVGRDRLSAPQDGRYDLFARELYGLQESAEAGVQAPRPEEADLACLPHFTLPATLADNTPNASDYPLLLVSQSLITQSTGWEGIVPTLQECYGLQSHVKWSSWVEINPALAASLGLANGDEVWVESQIGRLTTRVSLYPGLWPNAVFLPPGMGHHTLVKWGRNSPSTSVVGANPNQLHRLESESSDGQSFWNPVRVKIYRA